MPSNKKHSLKVYQRTLSQQKILVVDDNVFMQKLATSMLRQIDIKMLHCVSSGLQALEWLSNSHADIALIDWYMPGLNGRELIQCLKSNEQTKQLSIIIMTGTPTYGMIEFAKRSNVQGILAKPFSMQTLQKRLIKITSERMKCTKKIESEMKEMTMTYL